MATAILRKKNRAGGIRLLDFRLYYRAVEIKIVCYLHKTKNIEQWIRIKKPRNKPTHLWSTNLQQRRQEYTVKKTVSSSDETGNTESENALQSGHRITAIFSPR